MPETIGRDEAQVQRFDAADPEDRRILIENGLIWKGGPKAQAAAVKDLIAGVVPLNDKVPASIAAYVREAQGGDE